MGKTKLAAAVGILVFGLGNYASVAEEANQDLRRAYVAESGKHDLFGLSPGMAWDDAIPIVKRIWKGCSKSTSIAHIDEYTCYTGWKDYNVAKLQFAAALRGSPLAAIILTPETFSSSLPEPVVKDITEQFGKEPDSTSDGYCHWLLDGGYKLQLFGGTIALRKEDIFEQNKNASSPPATVKLMPKF